MSEFISAGEELIKVPYEAMGQEVWSGEEENSPETYTPKEMARLWSFEHAIRQANELEIRLNSDTPQEMWWVVKAEDGAVKSKSLLWKENGRMLNAMRETTLNMYAGHDMVDPETGEIIRIPGFIDEPHMKEAADQLLNQIHQEKADAEEFEKLELESMWNQP